MTASVRRSMAKGAGWMMGWRAAEQLISVASVLILARLLVPADFGLVAMAMVLYGLLEMLGELGAETVLIQKQDADRGLYDCAWTLNAGVHVLEAGLLVLLAAPAAIFYEEPRLEAVIQVLALALLASGFKNVGVVAFRKELEFHKEFVFLIARKLAGFAVTVPLAFAWRSYWALVAGIVTAKVVELGLSYWMHPYRPRPTFAGWREIYAFSKWLYLTNFLQFAGRRLPELLLGKLAGAGAAGVYSLSFQIGMLASTSLAAPLNRAVFPGYARLQTDALALKRTYLDVSAALALVALPAGFGLAALADRAVPVLLGEKWMAAVPVVQLLSVVGALVALRTNAGVGFLALGRPDYVTKIAALRILVLAPLVMWLGARHGAVGAAAAILVTTLSVGWVSYRLVFRALGIRVAEYWSRTGRPAAAVVVMWGVIDLLERHAMLLRAMPDALALAILAVAGAVTYVVTVAGLWALTGRPQGLESFALRQVLARLRRTGGSAAVRPGTTR